MSHSPAVRYLRDYVAVPSVNPMGRTDIDQRLTGERNYAELVRDQLRKLGIDGVVVGEGLRRSVVGEVRTASATETLMVASHLDTVPVDSMTIDPFDPVVKGGRLQGRGSCDTKAGLAALMAALERVLGRGSLARNLIVVGEADEEHDSVGVTDVLRHLGGAKVDFAIVTEPTELKLVNAHKGTASVRIAARGRACHSSDPSQGDNAIVRLAGAIAALDALGADLLANKRHAELGPATLCVSLVAGGQAHNIVPDRAWLVMDRRTLPGETAAEIQAEVDNALSQAGVVGVEIEDLHLGKAPLHTPPHHPAAVACHRALARSGCEPELCGVAFGTDAGLFAREGIPSLVLGPGSIKQAHTDTEYVDIDQLEKMQAVFEALLEGA